MSQAEPIATPDQRIRVFVSSTLTELADERRAVRDAISGLRLTPVMFELGARNHAPRPLYRAYLEQSDVFVGIYWQSYGWVAPDMEISGLEDELRLRGSRPALLYVKAPAPDRDPRLQALIDEIGAEGGLSYVGFRDADELAARVTDDLALLMTERFRADRGPTIRGRGIPAPITPLLGRDAELDELVGTVAGGARLVTLLGAGGIGKTRLAVAAGRALAPRFAGGAHFVDLAQVSTADEVPDAVAAAVGVHLEGAASSTGLLAATLDTPTLLVVDNCEHVLGAVRWLGELVRAAPAVQLLVTSRTPLKLRGEQRRWIEPLSGRDGVSLLVERAAEHGVDVAPDDPAAAAIVARLGGLPLAIELAASRLAILGLQGLERRLSASLKVLGAGASDLPERQRTLRAAIAWSHRELDDDAQALFARMSVFPAGASLERLDAVCTDGLDGDAVELVATLVDHSLVRVRTDGDRTRFDQLIVIREFAHEQLVERGERERILDRLADDVCREVATTSPGQLDMERPNLVVVMAWCLESGRLQDVVDILFAYWITWFNGDRVAEATAWVEQLGARGVAPSPRLSWVRGFLAFQRGEHEVSSSCLRDAVAGFTASGEALALARAHLFLAPLDAYVDAERAVAMIEGALARLQAAGDATGTYVARTFRSMVYVTAGRLDEALSQRVDVLHRSEAMGDPVLVALARWNLALSQIALGRTVDARAQLSAALNYFASTGYQEGIGSALMAAVALRAADGDLVGAVRLHAASQAIFDRIAVAPWLEVEALVAPILARARAELPDFAAHDRAGRHLPPDAALALAGVGHTPS